MYKLSIYINCGECTAMVDHAPTIREAWKQAYRICRNNPEDCVVVISGKTMYRDDPNPYVDCIPHVERYTLDMQEGVCDIWRW